MKQFFALSFFVLSILSSVIAQPFIGKQKTLGAAGFDEFTCTAFTTDGGSLLGGSSDSKKSKIKTENSRGSYDYWVIKMDSTGNIQWDKTIGGNSTDYLYAVAQTKDGGYILGGYSYSDISGEKSENSKGLADYWVVKLDVAVNIEWDKTIGGNDWDGLSAMIQTTDGGYFLGGYSSSNKSGDKSENSKGFSDYWIVKLDANGNILWDKTIGANSSEVLTSLQQTTDNAYVLGGYSDSYISGDKSENSRGGIDYWVVKVDINGYILWDKTIGGSGADFSSSIQQTVDDGYLLAGSSYSDISGDKSQHNRDKIINTTDYWIVKLDAAGNKEWDKTIGGSDNDYATSILQTKDGGCIVGGRCYSIISGEKTEDSRGYGDYWVVKLDRRGRVQWDKTIGGSGEDELYSIQERARDRYVLGGLSNSNISGEKDTDSKGAYDYWIVLLNYQKPIAQINRITNNSIHISSDKQAISVYPNPAKDILHIQANGEAVYTLTNNAGVTVITLTINGKGDVNVSRLQAGVYYLKNNSTGEVKKIIIQ